MSCNRLLPMSYLALAIRKLPFRYSYRWAAESRNKQKHFNLNARHGLYQAERIVHVCSYRPYILSYTCISVTGFFGNFVTYCSITTGTIEASLAILYIIGVKSFDVANDTNVLLLDVAGGFIIA